MKYERFFAFGCSFTKFCWPTWSDIIADDLGIPYENWALAGIGNVAIAHRMLECDLKNQFTDKDLIIVNWSSWHREDRIFDGAWNNTGSVFNSKPRYDEKFIDQFWNEENDIVKNATAIITSNRLFDIDYQSHMIDYEGYFELNFSDKYDFSKYQYYLDALPQKNLFNMTNNSQFNNKVVDLHPDVVSHLEHARTIYNVLGLEIKPTTVEKYERMQIMIVDNITYDLRTKHRFIHEYFQQTYDFTKYGAFDIETR